jgi:hypothetical protein
VSKPKKVIIPDDALKNIDEEERDKVKNMITEMFSKDMEELQAESKPVERLEGNELVCPGCGKKLDASGPTFKDDDEVVQIYDCWDCDRVFMGKAPN